MALTGELAFLDATAQAELVRKNEIQPIELVDAAIERNDTVTSKASPNASVAAVWAANW